MQTRGAIDAAIEHCCSDQSPIQRGGSVRRAEMEDTQREEKRPAAGRSCRSRACTRAETADLRLSCFL
eukprot:753835-Hanusia_phi.AAC.6